MSGEASRSAESDAGRFPSHLTFDGMTWPDPSDPNDVQWRLRYGQPSKPDLLFAASVMAAYHALIAIPQTTRNRRVRSIREALDASVIPPAKPDYTTKETGR